MTDLDSFNAAASASSGAGPSPDVLTVDLDGYEGPLDLLLTLARSQKVDLRRISVLALADQYLAFVAGARQRDLELAGDYLVMAAWLAYLKSRLLLPPDPSDPEPSGEEMAARLAWQLRRLEAMREAAGQLLARDRLGRERFARGAPEAPADRIRSHVEIRLVDLLRAYARLHTRDAFRPYAFDRRDILALDSARETLAARLAARRDWAELADTIPTEWATTPSRLRSATASTFAAALELARGGGAELAQSAPFAPLRLRGRAEHQAGNGDEDRRGRVPGGAEPAGEGGT